MKSLTEWRLMNEFAGTMPQAPQGALAPPVVDEKNEEPNDEDWKFYDQQIFGRLGRLLTMLTREIENKKLTLPRKGFIVQEVMDALGLDLATTARITNKVKMGMARRKAQMASQQAPAPPADAQTPMTPNPAQTGTMGYQP